MTISSWREPVPDKASPCPARTGSGLEVSVSFHPSDPRLKVETHVHLMHILEIRMERKRQLYEYLAQDDAFRRGAPWLPGARTSANLNGRRCPGPTMRPSIGRFKMNGGFLIDSRRFAHRRKNFLQPTITTPFSVKDLAVGKAAEFKNPRATGVAPRTGEADNLDNPVGQGAIVRSKGRRTPVDIAGEFRSEPLNRGRTAPEFSQLVLRKTPAIFAIHQLQ
jgi:hypothetical protein